MERKGRLRSNILTALSGITCMTLTSACTASLCEDSVMTETLLTFSSGVQKTKAGLPDEDKLSDINIMIFDGYGHLEKHIYLNGGETSCNVSLLKGARYSIAACANFGYKVKADHVDNTYGLKFHLAYPDEYREGMPMYACCKDILITDQTQIEIELIRLMARISLRVDRSLLSDDVRMDVIGVRIGNCPKSTTIFCPNKVEDEDGCFRVGFSHDDLECTPLNRRNGLGLSEELSLYMLENMQGRFGEEELADDGDKTFSETDPRRNVCSYIELEIEYTSSQMHSRDSPLIYRFYLGEDRNSLDIERNCHYRITIRPEDDGLKGDGWRVDKSGLTFSGTPSLLQYPSDYIVGNIGERIHIGCILTPSYAPFNIGTEYLEADKAEGIYEYETDEDGHGVTLTLTGAGRGLIYMEAGEPINDCALFIIEVNRP